jgi:hypothetical protein
MCDKENRMNESEFESIVATLDQENRQMRARMERLENENQSAQDTIARLMLEINRLHNEKV